MAALYFSWHNSYRVAIGYYGTKSDQIYILLELNNFLNKVADISLTTTKLGGDFNLFFDYLIETEGGNPFWKKIICKMKILQNYDLCDI